jgi:hypothetical protein
MTKENIIKESKRKKFARIAELRVNNALSKINLIANIANTKFYEYSEDDVQEIIDVLQDALFELKTKFNKKPNQLTLKFSLSNKIEDNESKNSSYNDGQDSEDQIAA